MTARFCEIGDAITLCYEEFGSESDPPVLLTMGLGTQMIGWREGFCEQLAQRGFRVIRYDNRDSGRSTHMKGRPPTLGQLVRRKIDPANYTLTDLAADAVGLLRELQLGPAHLVGASMGGMIGQTVAAHQPETVRSLVSIMSSTGNRWRGQPGFGIYRYLLRRAPQEREAYIEHMVKVFSAIGSPGFPQDVDQIRDLAGQSYDRDHDSAAAGRQLAAVVASGDRTAELKRITVPTLVIHGSKDRMIRPSGGRATARAIPGAQLMMIEGMGHDLPEALWPRLIEAISAHAHAADSTPASPVQAPS